MALIYRFKPRSTRSGPRPTPPRRPQNVTGRDNYVIAQALARHIVTERAKPRDEQAWRDLQDAIVLLMALAGERWAIRFVNACSDSATIVTTTDTTELTNIITLADVTLTKAQIEG